jgi:Domain of unknown function (DUF4389)
VTSSEPPFEPPSPERPQYPQAPPPPPPEAPSVAAVVAVQDPAGPPSPDYPVRLEISYPAELNRFLPLIKWLLVIPHFIVLFFIAIGAIFVGIFAFFAVLFTARFPRGAFEYLAGTFRWAYRVVAYFHLMTDAYPPFSMADDPSYPVRLHIEYPERIARWRPLVQWLLSYPYLIVAGLLYWLTGILSFIAFFTILFTKRIPRGMFELMVPGMRWQLRGSAYAYFMSDRYPPWEWG